MLISIFIGVLPIIWSSSQRFYSRNRETSPQPSESYNPLEIVIRLLCRITECSTLHTQRLSIDFLFLDSISYPVADKINKNGEFAPI